MTRRPVRRWCRAALVSVLILSVAEVVPAAGHAAVRRAAPPAPVPARKASIGGPDPAAVASVVGMLPRRSAAHPTPLLANPDQPVPTNRWFSSLVMGYPSQPAYAYPLAYRTTATGASVTYPAVVGTADTVAADNENGVDVGLGATAAVVASYDDLSVEVRHLDQGRAVATSRVTEGSPDVYFTLAPGRSATVGLGGAVPSASSIPKLWLLGQGPVSYGVAVGSGVQVALSGGLLNLHSGKAGGRFTVFVLPAGAPVAAMAASALDPIVATSVGFSRHGNTTVTTYRVTTASGRPTVFGFLPGQHLLHPPAVLGTLLTLYGVQRFARCRGFSVTMTSPPPPLSLDVAALSPAERARVGSLLAAEIPTTTFPATDSYGAGKELYRAANLLQLAEQLDRRRLAATMRTKLAAQLNAWLDPFASSVRPNRYFTYDPVIRGIVGQEPSFGSDQFDDHHFHYGYFIYAAAVLGASDPAFVRADGAMVDALVDDIASPVRSPLFPRLRVFDLYLGHSWADGFGLSPDGNDQESSSEAVNAWYAMYRWGLVIGDKALQDEGFWLYQHETEAALDDYVDIPLGAPQFRGYRHSIVSLVWGGKLDDATFFSPSPAAKLAIELIPMSPGQSYLGADPGRIRRNLAAVAAEGGGSPSLFPDYLLMYRSLAEPAGAAAALGTVDPADLDSADSLAYLTAFVDSRHARG